MPKLCDHTALSLVKAINVADSGEGKTGATASLIHAGYSARFLDFDNGVHVLGPLLTPEEQARVYVETLQDEIRVVRGELKYIKDPQAFSTALKLLDHWKTDDYDLGPLKKWTSNDILIIDSFTMLNQAAMRWSQRFQGPQGTSRLGEHPSQRDYGLAMKQVEWFLELLFNDRITPCHVIVNCHLKWMRDPAETRKFKDHGQGEIEITPLKCYPNALGQALPPIVATFFNTTLTMESNRNDHYIVPISSETVACKNPNFRKLKNKIKVDGVNGGLATVFETLLGHPGPGIAA